MTKNNRLAGHVVADCLTGFNVKFVHKGWTISLAADGMDTLVYKAGVEGEKVFIGTGADTVVSAVEWIETVGRWL